MRILIIGAGEVGTELASKLSREDHDVVIIDKSRETLSKFESMDVLTVQGNGASLEVLDSAGIKDTDLLIAATQVDEINIMACLLGKNNGAKRTIARVRQSSYGNEYRSLTNEKLGIDIVINPEQVAANEIVKVVKSAHASEIEFFCGGRVQMLGLRLTAESPLVGKKLKDLDLGDNTLIAAIIRDNDLIIPRGDDNLKTQDHVYLLTLTGRRYGWITGKDEVRPQKIMVMGAGKVGRHMVRMLSKSRSVNVKLIDNNLERCHEVADLYPDVMVLHGSGTDLDFLRQEDIEATDVFVAVSGRDEVNILSALLAKKLGVKKTIVEINRPDYAVLVDTLDIDTALRPRLLTAGRILKLVRKGSIVSIMILGEDQAEVIEINVGDKAPVIGKTLQEMKLPRNVLVGAILRRGKAIIPQGSDSIQRGDKVVLFCQTEMSQQATALFSE